jgi:hypothetical protein
MLYRTGATRPVCQEEEEGKPNRWRRYGSLGSAIEQKACHAAAAESGGFSALTALST